MDGGLESDAELGPVLDEDFDSNPACDPVFDSNPACDPVFDSNPVLDCDLDSNSAFDSNSEPDFESASLGANRQRACAVIEAQKRTRIDVEPA